MDNVKLPEIPASTEPEHKPVMLFGTDITRIPCFRNTFLYSIQGGLGLGLGTFLFTSRVPLATSVTISSFGLITVTYWFYCRYTYAKQKFLYAQIKAGMQNYIIYEGTDVEKEVMKDFKDDK